MKIFKQDIWYFFNDDGEDRRREKMMKIISGYYRRLLAHSQQRCDFYARQDSECFDASERSQLTVMTRLIWGTGTCAAAAIVKDKIVIGMNQNIISDDVTVDGPFACFSRLYMLTSAAHRMDAGLKNFLENTNNSMSREDVLSLSTTIIKDECIGLINAAYDTTRKGKGNSGNALLIGDYNNEAGWEQLFFNKEEIIPVVNAFDLLKGVEGLYERLDDFQAKMIAEKHDKVVVDWVLPFLRDFSVWVEWARFGQGPVVSKIIVTRSAQFVDDNGIACDPWPDFDENNSANLIKSLQVSLRTDAMIIKALSNSGKMDLKWLTLLRSLVVGDEYDWDAVSDKPVDYGDSVVPGVLAAFNWLSHERDQSSGDVNKVDFDEIALKLSGLVSVAVDRLMLRLSLDHILYHNNYQKNKKAGLKYAVSKNFLKGCLTDRLKLHVHAKQELGNTLSNLIKALQNNVVSDSDKQNLFSWAVEFMKNLHGLVNAVWLNKHVKTQIRDSYEFMQNHTIGRSVSLESFGSGDVHAEMKVVQHMMREQALSPLGVSKLCCPHCYAFIASLDPAGKTQCIGHHTKAFHTKLPWQVITDIGRSRYDYQNALLPADVINSYKDLSSLERSGEGVISLRSGQRINVLDFLHIVIEAMPHLHHPGDRLAQMVTGLTESSLNVLFKSSTGSSLPSHGDAKYMLPDTHLFMSRKLWLVKQDFRNRIRSKKIDKVVILTHPKGYTDLDYHGCSYNIMMNGPNQYVGFYLAKKGDVIKVVHNNPCGGRIGDNLLEALEGYAKKMGYYLQLTDLMIRQTLNCFESATWVVSNATKMLWILNADESKLLDLSVTDMFAADMVMGAAYDHHLVQSNSDNCKKIDVTSCDITL